MYSLPRVARMSSNTAFTRGFCSGFSTRLSVDTAPPRTVNPSGLHAVKKATMSLDTLRQDLRYTFRTLRRDTGFTTFALLIVGLGIGASATVFSVINALVLRPL